MAEGDLIDLLPVLERRGDARGILEGRDEIEQLRPLLTLQQLLEGRGVDPVLSQRNAESDRPVRSEGVEGADEGGILADDGVALVAEGLAGKLDALVAAADDDGRIGKSETVLRGLSDAESALPKAPITSRIGLERP